MAAPYHSTMRRPELDVRRTTRSAAGLLNFVRAAADILAVFTAFAISYHLYTQLIVLGIIDRPIPSRSLYLTLALVVGVISVVIFWYLGSYRERANVLNLWEFRVAVKGHLLTAAFFFSVLFVVNGKYSRIIIAGGLAIALLITLLERRVLAALQRTLQVSGRLGRRVLIYGCGEAGRLLMKKIVQSPHVGMTVVGFIDDSSARGRMIECRITQTDRTVFCAPVLGRLSDLRGLVHEHSPDELFVTAEACSSDRFPEILDLAQESGLQVAFVPQLGDIRVDQLSVQDLSAIPVLRPHVVPARPLYFLAKRVMDLTVAAVLLVLTAPLWLVAAVLIRLSGPGPIFFKQQRVGLGGESFDILKFRTMRPDAAPYATSPTDDRDPRITTIGRALRTAGLDELPQLLNVLRGDMSLVGPRPEMPFIVDKYTSLERQRLWAKPGITGLWQLSADRIDAIHVNLEYDLHYIRHQSLAFDTLILLETLFFTLEVVAKKAWMAGATLVDKFGGRSRRASEPTAAPTLVPTSRTGATGIGVGRLRPERSDNGVPHSAWQSRVLDIPTGDTGPTYPAHHAFTSKET